jgi:hypothetical protein
MAFEAPLASDLLSVLDDITPAEFRASLFTEPHHDDPDPRA